MAKPILDVNKQGGTAKVPSVEILSYVYAKNLPNNSHKFDDVIEGLHDFTKKLYKQHKLKPKQPTANALNNCNGRWGEYLFGVYAWNYLADKNLNSKNNGDSARYIYVKLPTNNSTTKQIASGIWISLLVKAQQDILWGFEKDANDPQVKEYGHTAFKLSSSNPDAVILKFEDALCKKLRIDPLKKMDSLAETNVRLMDGVFDKVKGNVFIEKNLECFLSIKTSTRSDRRYQFIHEGDDIKAMLMLLCTKLPLGVGSIPKFCQKRFFAFSLKKVSNADMKTMETAMTACISSPLIDPIWCVDKLFQCLKPDDVIDALKSII